MARERDRKVPGASDERLDEVLVPSEHASRELRGDVEPVPPVRIEGIVAAVEPVSRRERGRRAGHLGELLRRDRLTRRHLSASHREVRLHVLVRVQNRPAVEETDSLAVERGSSRPFLVDVQVVDVAAEERDPHGLVPVHEPWNGVGEVVVIGDPADLRGRPDDLAAPQEVSGLERKLPEEAVERGITGAELDLVLARLGPLDDHVHLFVSGADREIRLLRDLEVAELLQLLQALLDRLHVHHCALVQGELPPDHLVAGRGVSLDLEPAEIELVPLVQLHVDVDLVIPDLLVLRIGEPVDVAARLVLSLDALEPLDESLPIQNRPGRKLDELLQEHARRDHRGLRRIGGLPLLVHPGDTDGARVETLPLHDRDRDASPSLDLLRLRVRILDEDLDLRILDDDVLVASRLIERLDVLDVLVVVRLVVARLLREEAPQRVHLGLLHRHPQASVGNDVVALEGDRGDLDLFAFVDDEDDLLVRLGDVLDPEVDGRAPEPLGGVVVGDS